MEPIESFPRMSFFERQVFASDGRPPPSVGPFLISQIERLMIVKVNVSHITLPGYSGW